MTRPRTPIAFVRILVTAGALALVTGCLQPPPPPGPVTIELVNTTIDDVRPNLYTSATATDVFSLVVAANLNTAWSDRAFPELRPLETRTISIECADLASVGFSQPSRFDAASLTVTVSEDQVFVANGGPFGCGDTVRFVYFNDGATFRARVEFP